MIHLCDLNTLKSLFWASLLVGSTINSFADLTQGQAQQLSNIAVDVDMMEGYLNQIDSTLDDADFSQLVHLNSIRSFLQSIDNNTKNVPSIYLDVYSIKGFIDLIETDVSYIRDNTGVLISDNNYFKTLDSARNTTLTSILTALQDAQSSDEEFYQWIKDNFPTLALENLQSLLTTNNQQNLEFFNDLRNLHYSLNNNVSNQFNIVTSWQESSNTILNNIYQFLNSHYSYADLFETLGVLYYETEYYDNQQIISLLTSMTNQHFSVDMGIVTNIYYNTVSLSNNVEFIANYISTNKVDIENPISESVSEAQSQYSLDTAESFYTNKITRTVELNPEDAPDFDEYTNVTSVVQSLADSYEVQQLSSTTNQLFTSIHNLNDEVIGYLENVKQSDFFNKQYNTRVVLIKKGTIRNHPDFSFEFDFKDMNLPQKVTTFLTRLYDITYAILCTWALIDIFKWAADKFGD